MSSAILFSLQEGAPTVYSHLVVLLGGFALFVALGGHAAFRRLVSGGKKVAQGSGLGGPDDPKLVVGSVHPNEVTPAFLARSGVASIDWTAVTDVRVESFPGSTGLSEATLYQAQFSVKTALQGVQPAARLAPAPTSCVIKHYDTSICRTPTVAFRAIRCFVGLTSEKMAKGELYFYTRVAPLIAHQGSPPSDANSEPEVKIASLLFVAYDDRGEPSFARYLLGRGSGTTATLGLEDLAATGFTFAHTKELGLKDAQAIRMALRALASLHSLMWDRVPCDAPVAMMAQFLHRFGSKLAARLHKNYHLPAFVPSLEALLAKFPLSTPLQHPPVQRALRHVYDNWASIRAQALRIVTGRQTFVHGDYHHRNIGFRATGQNDGNAAHIPPVCAFDFQACGAGSAAHEVLYFLATSVPVALNCGEGLPSVPPSMPDSHLLTLVELREFDRTLLQAYHDHLPPFVKKTYPVNKLQAEVDTLVLHWAGCTLFDCATVTPKKLEQMQADPLMKALVEGAAAGTTRILLTAAAICSGE